VAQHRSINHDCDGDPDMNLIEIIGRSNDDEEPYPTEDDYLASRVADLEVIDGRLVIYEACDDYFRIKLDRAETQRLIDWLVSVQGGLSP
jgi:hypothetical protein